MQYKKLILVVFFLISFLPIVHAQRGEMGLNVGGAGYIGDLNQLNLLKISGQNIGVFTKINFDPHWGLGLHLNYGEVKADDALSKNFDLRQRNLNFKSTITEIAFMGSFNFFDMYSPGSKKRVTPYLFAGIGGMVFKPKGEWGGAEFDLKSINTEDLPTVYRNYSLVIPYGVGVKYKKNDTWTLFGQIGYRTTFTDYLDDVSGVYPVNEKFWGGVNVTDRSVGNVYKPGDQRGDFRKSDTYLFVNIGISYTFVSQKCFTF